MDKEVDVEEEEEVDEEEEEEEKEKEKEKEEEKNQDIYHWMVEWGDGVVLARFVIMNISSLLVLVGLTLMWMLWNTILSQYNFL